MKHHNKKTSKAMSLVIGVALIILVYPMPAGWCADPAPLPQPQAAVAPPEESVEVQPAEEYRYDPRGKADPFKPFVEIKTEAEKKAEKEKMAEQAKQLPPLERYSLEEYKLIGIVWNPAKKVAMVEDSGGKSYAIVEGTRIGMNEGRVEKILPDSIIVTERVRDAFDNVKVQQVVLKIKSGNEGEL